MNDYIEKKRLESWATNIRTNLVMSDSAGAGLIAYRLGEYGKLEDYCKALKIKIKLDRNGEIDSGRTQSAILKNASNIRRFIRSG